MGVDVDWQHDYYCCIFSSSLYNDGPIGGGFCGVNFDNSNSLKHLQYIFPTAQGINGTNTFNYTPLNSANEFPSVNYGQVVLALEQYAYM